jgi:Ca-activated chloride channel family protein
MDRIRGVLLALLWLVPGLAVADSPELPQRFNRWLEEVDVLITPVERQLFLTLVRDYQREAFIEGFWKVRDPYPRTARNELKERWPHRVAQARASYDNNLREARSRILLVHARPSAGFAVTCGTQRQAEVWIYHRGSDFADFPFYAIFNRPEIGNGELQIWHPGGMSAGSPLARRLRGCKNGDQFVRTINEAQNSIDDYEQKMARVLAKPAPRSREWVHTFIAHSTELPVTAEPLDVTFELAFPGRHQLRTVVQGLLRLDASKVLAAEFAGYRSYDFQLTGEVLLDSSLFESFRYKFGFPAEEVSAAAGSPGEAVEIPMAFQRYLRPGTYQLILLLDDLNSDHAWRQEVLLEVPRAQADAALPIFHDVVSEKFFAEAAEAIATGETSIRLIEPQGELFTGFVRFGAIALGEEIQRVRFFLDDQPILTKNRPPYNVEIDLGEYPDLHTVRVEGMDAEGTEVASDELLVNGGGYRFIVKLVEPRQGRRYGSSIRARAEVEVPEGRSLERLELYLNEQLVATLYQEPFVHPILLHEKTEVSYVRAVAYLPDGNSTEDMVFVNAPDYLEEMDIQFVELYTTVLDSQGRPVEGLSEDDFKVEEDGSKQSITRFERVEDQPIHAGILIDNSASMAGTLDEVRKAALSFFQQAIRPKDRAAVITFNSFPHLAVELTNDREQLGSGLAGLVAEGQTALYDSIMFSLYHFTGVKGQRAILVLSDGKDESSRFSFDEALDYARRAGITIYAIGLRLGDGGARNRLTRLADETGGRSFYIRDITELEEVYSLIQRELRSQYLIAYQSTNTSDKREFRKIDLAVDRRGVTVKTLSGYYP